jgi:hypothetical protein
MEESEERERFADSGRVRLGSVHASDQMIGNIADGGVGGAGAICEFWSRPEEGHTLLAAALLNGAGNTPSKRISSCANSPFLILSILLNDTARALATVVSISSKLSMAP